MTAKWSLVMPLIAVMGSGCGPYQSALPALTGKTYEFRNGLWYTGSGFAAKTWYSVSGVLRSSRPARIDSVIDLQSQYVVPPFAEGHNHWLEPNAIDAYVQEYLRDGVFYLKDQSNAPVIRVRLDSALNRPNSVDFISANQGFTGSGGHPLQIARQFLAFGSLPRTWTEADLPGNVVIVVDSLADLDRQWPAFIKGRPDFVKVFLLYSEEYERRKGDPRFVFKRGLNPALVTEIAKRAHAAGLRVSAHVYTAADFHNALVGGVDDIAHMPGCGFDSTLGFQAFRISPEDARLAAARHVTVTTTLYWLYELDSAQRRRLVDLVIKPNIALLRANGVPILLGSDEFRATPLHEATVLASLGIFTNAELLDLWTRTTPQSIFPKRRIGRLADGYETSLLVLSGDPTADFSNVKRIVMRVKQGQILPIPRAVAFPSLGGG